MLLFEANACRCWWQLFAMVKHITVRWNDEPASSHAYAQLIPHRTLHPPHLYAARPDSASDNHQRAAAQQGGATNRKAGHVQPLSAVTAALARTAHAAVGLAAVEEAEEDKLSSPNSPTCAAPLFASSPSRARLTSSQSHIDSINEQLAQLRAEAEDEAAGRQSAKKQQRAVSSSLTRRDVLQFRHSGCTGNVQVDEQVNRLMGSEHSQLTQLYRPKHAQPPPIAVQQHEQSGTVGSRNAAVSTAPFVFFSSQPRLPTKSREKRHRDNALGTEEQPNKEEKEREVKSAETAHPNAPLAAPLRTVPARRAATDKTTAHSLRMSRPHASSVTAKHSKAKTDNGEMSGSRAAKQSSPPPQPNPPPPAPTPQLLPTRLAQQSAHDSAQLPPRPGWLSWRVGPGTDTNQPAERVLPDSHALLTIGKAQWREVEVGGERRGKARVRQRRVEDEWQWNERLSREKRSRELLTHAALLPGDHGRVHEFDVAIDREKAMEQQARQQLVTEERRLNAMTRQAKQATDERYEGGSGEQSAAVYDAWTSHPFVHPTFPPPPPPMIPSSRSHPALSQAASHPSHLHFTAAPATAPAVSPSPPRPVTATARSAKSPTHRDMASPPPTAKRAASQKPTRRTDKPQLQRTSSEERMANWQPPPHSQPSDPPSRYAPTVQPPLAAHQWQPSRPVDHSHPLDDPELRLQRSIQQYAQQLRHDSAMVDRDEQYVRSMGSKDVRRQQMINNMARARRDIREKEAHMAALRRKLFETQQTREAAASVVAVAAPALNMHSSSGAFYRTPRPIKRGSTGSASKAVQVPDVFVAVRDTSDSRADDERLRLQRSIESDMAAIVSMLQSKVNQQGDTSGRQHTERPQRQAERWTVEVDDVTNEQPSPATSSAKVEQDQPPHHHHEHEHHYTADPMSLSASSSSSLPVSTAPSFVDSEAMHARALLIIQERQTELRSKLATTHTTTTTSATGS